VSEEVSKTDGDGGDDSLGYRSLIVTIVALILLGVSYGVYSSTAAPLANLFFLFMQVTVISIVIWQACDPFADAAQWIGTTFKIPGSVRGATLDAVASSMPELFSGVFFVVILTGSEGYGSTIATCAGSAVYNMMLIPAICGLTIAVFRKSRPTIDVERQVVTRDGLWFLGCELVLLIFLFQDQLYWWMALVLLLLYVVYVIHLVRDARIYRRAHDAVESHLKTIDAETTQDEIIEAMKAEGISANAALVDKLRKDDESDDEDEMPDEAGLLFGFVSIPLNHVTAWSVIVVCTAIAAVACYWLVEVTHHTAGALSDVTGATVPVFFVAVILAAAASSVPDTFLSVGSAMRGDDSGAVSNAFGSNIFDICICLSIPLLINCAILGWQPVSLLSDGEPIPGLVDLRILLWVLSLVTVGIMLHKHQLTRFKSIILIVFYLIFVAYAVAGSLGYSASEMIFSK